MLAEEKGPRPRVPDDGVECCINSEAGVLMLMSGGTVLRNYADLPRMVGVTMQ